jgi:hypothetical protein
VISTKGFMKCFPFSAQRADYVLHPASEGICINVRKTVILLQGRRSRRTLQVEDGVLLAIKHMHVSRLMVVQINHDAGSADAENRWHVVTLSVSCAQVNPNAWVYLRLLFSAAKDCLQGPTKLREEAVAALSAEWPRSPVYQAPRASLRVFITLLA